MENKIATETISTLSHNTYCLRLWTMELTVSSAIEFSWCETPGKEGKQMSAKALKLLRS